ncbi:MAG: hypothetical protein EZS28_056141, partial [Streblomastix strix]
MYLQSAIMVMISQARVRDFLVLPELKIIEHIIPDDKQIAVEVKNGEFAWGAPPEIPMTKTEKQQLEKETQRRKEENQRKQQ